MKTIINLKEIKGEHSHDDPSLEEETPKIKIDLSGIEAIKNQNKEEIKFERKDSLKILRAESENQPNPD